MAVDNNNNDYNSTLNLPQSEFPMRGNLPAREPVMLKDWQDKKRYYKMIENNAAKPKYILHDGPPYANGDIHMGHALNKILKDFVIRYKNMSGFCAPHIPGWDTHGLPIELKALKKDGVDPTAIDKVSLRELCREFAISFVENQKGQFKRLGIMSDFDSPYLTLQPEYEARQIEIFGEMAKKNVIYKGLKPVYWCTECGTALAEAEIEYAQDPCYSIYVKFQTEDDKGIFSNMGIDKEDVYFLIWTTTTWTLPGNVAVCLGPSYEYTLVKTNGQYLVMAKELIASTMAAADIAEYETVGSFKGSELEYMTVAHPFLERKSLVICGDHVTLESGTGCVHTAPGHGVDDFEVCKKYEQLPVVVPVDSKGFLTELAGEFEGLSTNDANKAIAKKLTQTGHLFATNKMIHQYPHCWRCKKPILFRATEQWFCSIDAFKAQALSELPKINWIPSWGEKRIEGMIKDRSDWCISRQRTWGVPIPIVYCNDCKKPIVNDITIKAISDLFKKEGSDAWYKRQASEFIPSDVSCECGCKEFTKETDIMDVWFDSGVSHAAVLQQRDNLAWPADLYLEGGDQYRGWFQSSLLTSVAWSGKAPYKAVCTHGMVVDAGGVKQSKSLGNGTSPQDIIKQYGADILRLWVASSDYHSDIRVSGDIIKQLSEAYRKIRNTAKYILGNLYDFNPDKDMLAYADLQDLDKLAMHKLEVLMEKVHVAYEELDFHVVYHAIHNFCVVDMSNFYLDIIKDRLYCEKSGGIKRRAAQTAMYRILDALTRMLAPILAYTSEEIWGFMPHMASDNAESVLFNDMILSTEDKVSDDFAKRFDLLYAVRGDVQKALEIKRTDGLIGKSLEARVVIHCDDSEMLNALKAMEAQLPTFFICSQVEFSDEKCEFSGELSQLSITVSKCDGEKCERCWIYGDGALCKRCAEVLA